MPPATGIALVLLVAFVLPGFVTVLFQERTFRSADDPTPLDRLLRVVYYSVWSYLLLAVVALVFGVDRDYVEALYRQYEHDPAELVWRGALAVLVPSALIATATRAWHGSRAQGLVLKLLRINERHEQPTAWDFFFRQRNNVYVRATTKAGGRVLGFYGARSFAAYAKDGLDLYLERLYVEDAEQRGFGPEVPGHHGVWLRGDDVVALEFYDPHYESKETNATDSESTGGPTGAEADAKPTGDGGPQAPGDDHEAAHTSAPATAPDEQGVRDDR